MGKKKHVDGVEIEIIVVNNLMWWKHNDIWNRPLDMYDHYSTVLHMSLLDSHIHNSAGKNIINLGIAHVMFY